MARALPVALCLIAGCSVVLNGDEHQGNPPPDMGAVDLGPQPLDPSDACNRFADVICRGAFDCCSMRPTECESDEETCISECKRDYQVACLENIGQWVDDSMANYDSVIAGEVLFELQGKVATCDLTVPRVFAVDLVEIPQGSLDAGDPGCDPVEGLGEVDITKASYCAGDLDCLSTGGALGSWACGDRRGEGEACTTYLECERDLGCGPTNVCGTREPNGGSCLLAGDCQSFVCERAIGELTGRCVAATEENTFCVFLDPAMMR